MVRDKLQRCRAMLARAKACAQSRRKEPPTHRGQAPRQMQAWHLPSHRKLGNLIGVMFIVIVERSAIAAFYLNPPRRSTSTLTKLPRPILKLLQALLAHRRPNGLQAGLEILKLNGSYLIHGHGQQFFTKRAQGAHGSVFRQCGDIRTRET
jgi:hypothetical protein